MGYRPGVWCVLGRAVTDSLCGLCLLSSIGLTVSHVRTASCCRPQLDVTDMAVASITDSPKPPPGRITLTLPVLNAGRNVLFVTTGGGKAEVLHEIFHVRLGGEALGQVEEGVMEGCTMRSRGWCVHALYKRCRYARVGCCGEGVDGA